jgi:hypothetical protein
MGDWDGEIGLSWSHPYMGYRESRPGFRARATFFLAHSFFVRLEKLVSSPRPMLVNGRRAQGRSRTRTCAPVRALSLTDPSTPADLGPPGDDVQRSRDRPLVSQRKKTAEPYIRSARPRAKPISHMLGKKEAGLDGTNLWAGIEAMNGPGHTSIPVRRTQGLQRARASDKLVTPP